MDLSKNNWFRKLVHDLLSEEVLLPLEYMYSDEPVYHIIQPTGLMYGLPTNSGKATACDKTKEMAKVQLAASMVNIYKISEQNQSKSKYDHCLKMIYSFYKGLYPDLTPSAKNWIGKSRDASTLCEIVFDKRISKLIQVDKQNIWSCFFNNSQLFIDVFLFRLYYIASGDDTLLEYLRQQKDEIAFTSLKVIAAAAHANKKVVKEERHLFDVFINNKFLSNEKKRIALEYLEHGIGIQKITMENSDSWVLKKFFLELAIVTIWSDQVLDDMEIQFIKEFAQMMELGSADRELSLLAVEGFFIEFWNSLNLAADRLSLDVIQESFLNRLNYMISSYDHEIIRNIKSNEELVCLFSKASTSELDSEERFSFNHGLIKAVESLPVFRFIHLPETFLDYKKILKILPKKVVQAVLL
ncbi:TerB family tellurite resistance protein [Fulvivirga sp. M361]|uniref:tellurite resistance TerB family protein n=1 Tax=Fulvivirga sp. M361 TaxID=2594266 RepID=UPI00117A87B0|nr:TerB family tellurite resistance protein [Fulvivirga sp. M361]TRX58798.1 TerB family tellurite resistance protein [Fulvivirga sp. M361]